MHCTRETPHTVPNNLETTTSDSCFCRREVEGMSDPLHKYVAILRVTGDGGDVLRQVPRSRLFLEAKVVEDVFASSRRDRRSDGDSTLTPLSKPIFPSFLVVFVSLTTRHVSRGYQKIFTFEQVAICTIQLQTTTITHRTRAPRYVICLTVCEKKRVTPRSPIIEQCP
jgi:hypothetical protein